MKICKPWNNLGHCSWFNGWKKMYCMNNIIVMDHHGLIIYFDLEYLGSYHDVSIFRQSNIHKSWCRYCVHTNEYFEYLLKNPGYMGEDMFLMHHIGRRELVVGIHMDFVNTYNKMRASLPFHSILRL
jgi:hypothetical protein